MHPEIAFATCLCMSKILFKVASVSDIFLYINIAFACYFREHCVFLFWGKSRFRENFVFGKKKNSGKFRFPEILFSGK